jgi:hypothetical protein
MATPPAISTSLPLRAAPSEENELPPIEAQLSVSRNRRAVAERRDHFCYGAILRSRNVLAQIRQRLSPRPVEVMLPKRVPVSSHPYL